MYNTTAIGNSTNVFTMFASANNLVFTMLSVFILISFFVMLLVLYSNMEKVALMIVASFMTTIIGGLMFALNLVTLTVFIIPVTILLISLGYKILAVD